MEAPRIVTRRDVSFVGPGVDELAFPPKTNIQVQASGDAHLMNFGLFASPERTLLFDLNDFDESLPGPWKWDIKRLSASIVVAGRQRGLSDAECKDAATRCARSYRKRIRRFSALPFLDIWYSRVQGKAVLKAFPGFCDEHIEDQLEDAKENDQHQAIEEIAKESEPRIKEDRCTTRHDDRVLSQKELMALLWRYRSSLNPDRRHLFEHYRVVDHALNVVGVGSVGTRTFAVLLAGAQDERLVLHDT